MTTDAPTPAPTPRPAPVSASVAREIPAPADRVWRLVGGFDALPDWLPYIPSSVPGEGGRTRTLTNSDGGVIVERLISFDEKGRSYSYSIEQAPFPVTGYLSTITVRETGENSSTVEWSGTFTPDGVSDEEAAELFRGIYDDGLTALRDSFGA
ncbi:SRPBCC family protein [Streptomyces tsukubensis]|uniref:SRPBCC family protein n=1 Tax=Streptomyces tsukubensis TaxID=83656 RepID=A0A1V4AGQ1_9ACTN|nr:SRPBCC family protein [Streptomyces tsukubensis]OON82613.1 hypothetical protein B1H18_00625 [Streptomyces tsukubensis]QFR92220.1 SRPBCC family protein [Streptomyces tsukubensis]